MFRFDKQGPFHDGALATRLAGKLGALARQAGRALRFMHVCGTHEHVIASTGLRSILPNTIEVISGPGCPVCVCSVTDIDRATWLARQGHVVTSFGDMMRVPSANGSLNDCRAAGHDVRVVYAIDDAIDAAAKNPGKEVVFLAVGFETFAPVVAAALLSDLPPNFSVLCSLKTMPAVMELLLALGNIQLDGFVTPGHVSTIIGTRPYDTFSSAYKMPVVTAGFQPVDVLLALAMLAKQSVEGVAMNENEYKGVVTRDGNERAKQAIASVFDDATVTWRGIGPVPGGGYSIKREFEQLDAVNRFGLDAIEGLKEAGGKGIPHGCSCHLVIMGQAVPKDCPLFLSGKCTPGAPIGPCMVSAEGTCKIAHEHRGMEDDEE